MVPMYFAFSAEVFGFVLFFGEWTFPFVNEPYPSATYVTKMFPFQWSQVSVRW